MTNEIESLRDEIEELKLNAGAAMALSHVIATTGFELTRALIASMQRHGITKAEISAELSAFLANRPVGIDANVDVMVASSVNQLKMELGAGIVTQAGHA